MQFSMSGIHDSSSSWARDADVGLAVQHWIYQYILCSKPNTERSSISLNEYGDYINVLGITRKRPRREYLFICSCFVLTLFHCSPTFPWASLFLVFTCIPLDVYLARCAILIA